MDLRQHWREAANILLLRPTNGSFSVLTVRGSGDSSLQKRSYVTPGGTLDSSDFSAKWCQLFDKFGSNSHLKVCCALTRPPIISDNIMIEELRRSSCDEEDFVSADIALRIAAIRHLFIKTGILLVKPQVKSQLNTDIKEKWRLIISQSPRHFFKMCDKLEVVPDISSLKEWWNWLTPSCVGSSPRFDTIYYICFINSVDVNECQHWSHPNTLIKGKTNEEYLLSPAQIYEFSRLMNFNDMNEVNTFATQRQKYGINRWIPVLSLYRNGAISVMPGDDLYPNDVELIATKPVRTYPQSIEEIRQKSVHLNRMELRGTDCEVVVNLEEMPLKQIRPLSSYQEMSGKL